MQRNKNTLTLGSLFDGSGGFPLAGIMCGITPVWCSEIEPFPIRVTEKNLPFMKHYGDIATLNGDELEPVDIITFGSPCQDMSIAGKRDGLDGFRSSLFFEAIRIVKEMRCKTDGKYPRFIVWENVPGAFSSNKGEDFKAVLQAICQVKDETLNVPKPESKWSNAGAVVGNGFSICWRALDAQFWGVPQRRKRIFLVADFAGECAEQILFKSEGLSGYSAASFRSWQRAASDIEKSTNATGFDGYNSCLTDDVSATLGVNCGTATGRNGIVLNDQGGSRMDITNDVTATLRAEAHHPPCVMDVIPVENHPGDSRVKVAKDGKVQTLSSRMGTGGNNVPLLLKVCSECDDGSKGALVQKNKSETIYCNNDKTLFEPCSWDGGQVSPTLTKQNAGGNQRMPDKDNFNCIIQAFGVCSKDSNAMKSKNPNSGFYKAETSRTIDGNGGNPTCNQGGMAVVESYVLQGSMIGRKDENGPQGDGINKEVSFTLNTADRHTVYSMTTGGFTQIEKEKSPTLMARDYKDPTAVAYGIGRDVMNQGKNAQFTPSVFEEVQPTLIAKGPGAVAKPEPDYTVRRLTPTECARLQGFPDFWCSNLGIENPTDEEIDRYEHIFEEYRLVMDDSKKPKSRKQIIKWLKAPHSDSAEYKMWGNGVALPCVCFVLAGIVYSTQLKA